MGNIIQQAAGDGVFAKSARSVRVLGNFLDNNGKVVLGTGAVAVSNSGQVSIVGNTMAENAAADELASASGTMAFPAHVHLSGTNDNLILSGNVYIPLTSSGNNSTGTNSGPSAVLLHPDYVYDVAPGSTLSNTVIADAFAIQNLGVLTPAATPFLSNSLPDSGSAVRLQLGDHRFARRPERWVPSRYQRGSRSWTARTKF